MLGRLLALVFGKKAGRSAAPAASDGASRERVGAPRAPRPAGPAVATPQGQGTEQGYLCREAVLDREQRVVGYEFMLRKATRQRLREAPPALVRAYDEVLIRNLANMQLDRLLGQRLAFVGISPATLGAPVVELLPPRGTVLAIRAGEGVPADLDSLAGRVKELKALGYRIAVDRTADSDKADALLELSDFLTADVSAADLPDIKDWAEAVTKASLKARVIAMNVASVEEFEAFRALPFHLFQGPFVTRREQGEESKSDASQTRLLELLNLARQDAETAELVKVFKQDAVLSFKLLRFINSPGGGLLNKVTSLEHAMVVLGRQKLYRWLTLLLFSAGAGDERSGALLENVLVRARLAERLGRGKFSQPELDDLFVVGIFSLLDVLLRTPMERLLAQLALPEPVVRALLHRDGPYAPYLELAIACEKFDQERIDRLAAVCGLEPQQVNLCHVEALVWAQQIQM